MNNLAPSYLCDLVKPRNPCSTYSLRSNEDQYCLAVSKRPKYKKMENAFSFSGPDIWNSLPVNIRSMNNIMNFKKALKTHYFRQAFSDLLT